MNYETKLVYKKKNFWLVLKRPLLAGFNAPIDNITKQVLSDENKEEFKDDLHKYVTALVSQPQSNQNIQPQTTINYGLAMKMGTDTISDKLFIQVNINNTAQHSHISYGTQDFK